MRQTEAHITSANINPSARTGNIRAKSRRDPWCPAASSDSPLTISFTAQPACRHLPLLPMKGVQPASLLRLLYLLYNMNCRGLNPATRRHLSYKTVRGRNGEEVVVIDDLFEARIQDLSDLTSSFLTFFTHFLKWAPAASGRPLFGSGRTGWWLPWGRGTRNARGEGGGSACRGHRENRPERRERESPIALRHRSRAAPVRCLLGER